MLLLVMYLRIAEESNKKGSVYGKKCDKASVISQPFEEIFHIHQAVRQIQIRSLYVPP